MGYYRGDYYRGDYYRGDPFLGGLIAGAARAALPIIGKAARWMTGGKLIGAGGATAAAGKVLAGAGAVATVGTAVQVARRELPVSMGPMQPMEPMGGGESGGGMGTQWTISPSGRRIRKRWSARYGRWVAVRTMNPLNPRALSRAVSRATRFEKFAKKVINVVRNPGGGKKFKSKRR